jgi:hypothetical protein
MDVIVKVSRNYLKLMADTFFHIQCVKLGEMKQGVKYKVETDAYGIMGEVSVISLFPCQLYDLKNTVMLLTDGDLGAKERIKELGAFSTDYVQCAILRFTRRNQIAFTDLLNAEIPKAGVTITKQSILF